MAALDRVRNLFHSINVFLGSATDPGWVDAAIVGAAQKAIQQYLKSRSDPLNALKTLSQNMQSASDASSMNTFALALSLCGKQIEVVVEAMDAVGDEHFNVCVIEMCIDAIAKYFITLGKRHNAPFVSDLGKFITEVWNTPSHLVYINPRTR